MIGEQEQSSTDVREEVFVVVIVMVTGATDADVERVVKELEQRGYGAHVSKGVEKTIIGAIGIKDPAEKERIAAQLQSLPIVERVVPIMRPFKLVSREWQPETTVIDVGTCKIGSRQVCVMAGPCSVESREQIIETAKAVKAAGATVLRGGAFKPRTSPYDFQGLGEEALKYLKEATEVTGLPVITEVMDVRDVELVAEHAAIFQIGTRNMQNYNLLREVGRTRTPVFLKRGMSATIEEWLKAAEYIMSEGNHQVMLCERGIRTFETAYRNSLDLNAVPTVKKLTHLPILVDPSQGTGWRDMVLPMSLAAIAAGADGLEIEVHPHPERALSDAQQQITPAEFEKLMNALRPLVEAVGRTL
ncbi:MAG: 3-deoxy-7-phosphoheptulonate synthase [Abditibacteriales bacterium]|nr:3-deoxy-7-phosphoheptulonate synthase [Abditibacteriales bacterium]MDW8367561.1 3-deoxy-7-phosphoheptulonate synthase [Abditibacteriales bacterium]